MYFKRIRKLDLPENLRDRLVDEIDTGKLVPTGMNDRETFPPWEVALQMLKSNPETYSEDNIEYFKKIYKTTNIVGWQPSADLSKDIYKHYDSFFKMVPDEPKIIIKYVSSDNGKFNLHCGKLQTASLTCLIRGYGPETVWYKPKPEFEKKYRSPKGTRHINNKGMSGFPPEVEKVTSIRLSPWEMIFFDHNSLHEVEGIFEGFERILFSIGFLNITETELEDIYDEWWIKNKKD